MLSHSRSLCIAAAVAGLAVITVATPAFPQNSGDGAGNLVALCQRMETAMAQSCRCTVDKARRAGLKEADLRSLLADDGKQRPVAQSTYTKFWEVRIQCIGEAGMVGLPQPGAALAGLPPPTRSAAAPAPARAGATVPVRAGQATPIPLSLKAPSFPPDYDRVFYFTPSQTRAMLGALEGTTWRRAIENVDVRDPEFVTYQFLPGRAVIVKGEGYTKRYETIVADEPGFAPEDYEGIRATPQGLFGYGGPDAPERVAPYLVLQDERGRQEGLWLGYWGGAKAYVGYSYRSDQLYQIDTLALVAGKPKAFDPANVEASAPATAAATATSPLAARIGTFAEYPETILGRPGGCDATFLKPSAVIDTPRRLAAQKDRAVLGIYMGTNMASATREIAAIKLDGRAILLEFTRESTWQGQGLTVRYVPGPDRYNPEDNGIGFGKGELVVESGDQVARFPVLTAFVC